MRFRALADNLRTHCSFCLPQTGFGGAYPLLFLSAADRFLGVFGFGRVRADQQDAWPQSTIERGRQQCVSSEPD
jgi:hypothetical protein